MLKWFEAQKNIQPHYEPLFISHMFLYYSLKVSTKMIHRSILYFHPLISSASTFIFCNLLSLLMPYFPFLPFSFPLILPPPPTPDPLPSLSPSVLCLPGLSFYPSEDREEEDDKVPFWSWRLSQNQWAHLEAKLVVLSSGGKSAHTYMHTPTHTRTRTHCNTHTESSLLIFSQTLSLTFTRTFPFSHQSPVTTGLGKTKYRLPSVPLTDRLPLNSHTIRNTSAHTCAHRLYTENLMTICFSTESPLPAIRNECILCLHFRMVCVCVYICLFVTADL